MSGRGIGIALIGLAAGALIGVLLGWILPIQSTSAGLESLHPDYKFEYAVMVAAAYAYNSDWDLAQARLGRLAEGDPALFVVQATERAIAEGRRPTDIRNLTRMAQRFGYVTPAMEPYLPGEPES